MIDPNPCNGCTEWYTACHDYCKRRQKWLEQHHAQQKHLKETKNRWCVPMTAAREKAYEKHRIGKYTYSHGGSYE